MMLINLTPHTINMVNASGEVTLEIEPELTPARCKVEREVAFTVAGFDVNRSVFGEVVGLPPVQDETWYIVSRIVAEAAKTRKDLLVPDETVRDEEGRIVGCKSFATI